MQTTEYKVIEVRAGLFAGSALPVAKLERALNDAAKDRWEPVTIMPEPRRFMAGYRRSRVFVVLRRAVQAPGDA